MQPLRCWGILGLAIHEHWNAHSLHTTAQFVVRVKPVGYCKCQWVKLSDWWPGFSYGSKWITFYNNFSGLSRLFSIETSTSLSAKNRSLVPCWPQRFGPSVECMRGCYETYRHLKGNRMWSVGSSRWQKFNKTTWLVKKWGFEVGKPPFPHMKRLV